LYLIILEQILSRNVKFQLKICHLDDFNAILTIDNQTSTALSIENTSKKRA
jgi:hypothetical protein